MYQIVLAALVTGFTWIVANQWGWDVVVRWQNALIERVISYRQSFHEIEELKKCSNEQETPLLKMKAELAMKHASIALAEQEQVLRWEMAGMPP